MISDLLILTLDIIFAVIIIICISTMTAISH